MRAHPEARAIAVKGFLYVGKRCIGPVRLERIVDGSPPESVKMVRSPVVGNGCANGRHCAAHGSGPFNCCLCGAAFLPVDSDTRTVR